VDFAWRRDQPLHIHTILALLYFQTLISAYSRWANEICSDDSEERAITVATMNEFAYIFQIWLPLVVWRQTDAPRYHIGYVTSTVISIFLIMTTFIVRMLHKREVKRKYVFLAHGTFENHLYVFRKLTKSERSRVLKYDGENITRSQLQIRPGQPKKRSLGMMTTTTSTSLLSSPDSISMESHSFHSPK
jgi:hypothetical protein